MKKITFISLITLISCIGNHKEKNETIKSDTIKVQNQISRVQNDNKDIKKKDSLKTFVVDDFPVTNDMFEFLYKGNEAYKIKSGNVLSYDKAWFRNDTLNQALVFELYTDFHRLVTYDFYLDEIPTDLIKLVGLHIENGKIASEKDKNKNFIGFIEKGIEINSAFFITNKGLKIGDLKEKAIKLYGEPSRTLMLQDKVLKLEWNFYGEYDFEGDFAINKEIDTKGKPIAKDSFGHDIIIYLRNTKIIGIIFQNDIP